MGKAGIALACICIAHPLVGVFASQISSQRGVPAVIALVLWHTAGFGSLAGCQKTSETTAGTLL